MSEYWIFTFGSGQEHAGKYVKIRGTHNQARKKMFEKYGKDWGFQYSEKRWKKKKKKWRKTPTDSGLWKPNWR